MKKTIRKKMMRDLQQAFIDGQDPNPQWDQVQIAPSHKTGEGNLLEMLKSNPTEKSKSPTVEIKAETSPKKPGFWKKLTRRKNKR